MRNRPKKLDWYAFFLTLIALSMPVQIMILYGHTPLEASAVAAKLAPLNWLIMVLAPLTAWLIRRASRLAVLAVPILAGVVVYNNWLVAEVGTDYSPELVAVASLGFLISLASVFDPQTLTLIQEPRLRWWLTPARRRAAVPVRVKILGHTHRYSDGNAMQAAQQAVARAHALALSSEFYARTYDISESGAFIPVQAQHSPVDPNVLDVGSQCYVTLGLRGMSLLQCRAEIVRSAAPRGSYPGGVGIRFLGLTWSEQRKLRGYIRELEGAPATV